MAIYSNYSYGNGSSYSYRSSSAGSTGSTGSAGSMGSAGSANTSSAGSASTPQRNSNETPTLAYTTNAPSTSGVLGSVGSAGSAGSAGSVGSTGSAGSAEVLQRLQELTVKIREAKTVLDAYEAEYTNLTEQMDTIWGELIDKYGEDIPARELTEYNQLNQLADVAYVNMYLAQQVFDELYEEYMNIFRSIPVR